MTNLKIGDLVKVVRAESGSRHGPYKGGRYNASYKERLGDEIVLHSYDEASGCFYNEERESFYPWRLELINTSLENE